MSEWLHLAGDIVYVLALFVLLLWWVHGAWALIPLHLANVVVFAMKEVWVSMVSSRPPRGRPPPPPPGPDNILEHTRPWPWWLGALYLVAHLSYCGVLLWWILHL